MKKVLIISYDFPPVNNVASRRYGDMVSYMPNYDWEPYILTTNNSGDLKVEIPETNIIRIGKHHQQGLIVEGPGVHWLPKFMAFWYVIYKRLNLNFRSADRFIFSLPLQVIKKLDYFKKINPDIILATYGPATSLWIGNLLSRRMKKPWVADFRDPGSLTNYSALSFIDKCVDRFLISSASGIITVSPTLAYFLADFYNKKAMVVFNGYKDTIILNTSEKNRSNKKPQKIIYYAGRFNSHQIESVKLLIDWLSKCGRDDIVFRIRSLGPEEINREIYEYTKSLNISGMVNILRPAEDKLIQQESREADILAVFVDHERYAPITAGTITGKLLKLLPLGIPVLVIGRKDSDIGDILNETQSGYLVTNFLQLDIFMNRVICETLKMRPLADKIKDFSSNNQCKRLCSFLDRLIAKKIAR